MSQPLRMDEMGPGVSSRTLEACRMSNEAPADDEVAARVRATIAGDFQPGARQRLPHEARSGVDRPGKSFSYVWFRFSIFFDHF